MYIFVPFNSQDPSSTLPSIICISIFPFPDIFHFNKMLMYIFAYLATKPTDPSRRRICGVSNCFASQTNTTSNPAQQNKQIIKCSSQTNTTSNPTQQNKQITQFSSQIQLKKQIFVSSYHHIKSPNDKHFIKWSFYTEPSKTTDKMSFKQSEQGFQWLKLSSVLS